MKTKFTYTTTNKLTDYIKLKAAQETIKGTHKLIKDIVKELSEYTEVTEASIRSIMANNVQASLPLAFKIAEYIGEPVTEIFFLKSEK